MNKYSVISFPTFGIEWDPQRYFAIGSLNVYVYGIIIATGLLLAVWYAYRRSRQFGLVPDDIADGVLCVTPFAFLCARLYYCVFYWEEGGYGDNLLSILYIWEGGIAIYGGVIGAILGILVFCKVKKLKVGAVLDIVALGFLIGQCVGRWGNFFNREAFGSETLNFMRMGLYNTITKTVEYHHPTFLYESLWNLVGFIGLHFLSKRRKYDGQIALGYAAWYGLGRTLIEGLRTDSLYWGDFRVSQLLAAVSCAAALLVLIWQWTRVHEPANLFVNQVALAKAEEEAAAAQEEAETLETAEPAEEAPAEEQSAEVTQEQEKTENE